MYELEYVNSVKRDFTELLSQAKSIIIDASDITSPKVIVKDDRGLGSVITCIKSLSTPRDFVFVLFNVFANQRTGADLDTTKSNSCFGNSEYGTWFVEYTPVGGGYMLFISLETEMHLDDFFKHELKRLEAFKAMYHSNHKEDPQSYPVNRTLIGLKGWERQLAKFVING